MNRPFTADVCLSRRSVLEGGARIAGAGAAVMALGSMVLTPGQALAQASGVQPEEELSQTMERLFAKRPIKDAGDMMEFKIPVIAENGSVVPARVEVKSAAVAKGKYVKAIYLIVDKNRRPMTAKYTFSADAGGALVGTNLRLGATSNVRAVAEMSDGSLFQATQEVRVTVGGCGG
jgi:sulfur-oxidizing protein SoxY